MEIVLGSLCVYTLFKLCVVTDQIGDTTKKVIELDYELRQKEQ